MKILILIFEGYFVEKPIPKMRGPFLDLQECVNYIEDKYKKRIFVSPNTNQYQTFLDWHIDMSGGGALCDGILTVDLSKEYYSFLINKKFRDWIKKCMNLLKKEFEEYSKNILIGEKKITILEFWVDSDYQ